MLVLFLLSQQSNAEPRYAFKFSHLHFLLGCCPAYGNDLQSGGPDYTLEKYIFLISLFYLKINDVRYTHSLLNILILYIGEKLGCIDLDNPETLKYYCKVKSCVWYKLC